MTAKEPETPTATGERAGGWNALAALDLAQAVVRDLDGVIRFWSAGAERLYGWTPAQAVGQRSHDLLATRFPQPLAEIEAELRRTGRWHGELQQRTSDGRTLHVNSQWAVLNGGQARPAVVAEINNDITLHAGADAAVHQLASIVESSNDAIIGKDLDGIVTSWNRAAEAMFGYHANEIIGQSILLLFPPDRVAEEAAILEKVRLGQQVDHYETERYRKDGTVFPASLTVSPILDGKGAIVGAFKIVRDLSEQRELRAAQAQLFHVQRLNELGQLISALVHEVNQPLTAIGNYANAARRLLTGGNAANTELALQRIGEQTERANQIIQRLRSFVRKGSARRDREDLARLIEESVALASISLNPERIAFATRIEPGAPVVAVDRVQIQQVLFNLVRNAVEALGASPRREIVIAARRQEDGAIEVSVADTGPGLAPEVRENLFQPFLTTKGNGVGIGLSVCQSIVAAHGGRLWADDNPGGGTIFRFTLPPPDDASQT